MSAKRFAALAAATALTAFTASATAADVSLKVQSSFNAGDVAFKRITDKWVPLLKTMSGGAIDMEILPTGAVVPHKETPDAVGVGVLDGNFTNIPAFSGRNPAFAILGDLIAGYDSPDQVQSFCRYGGGEEMLQKVWDEELPDRIHVVGCAPYTREAFVSSVEIRSVEDFEGVKVRSPQGLAADVFRRAGATPVSLPYSEVYTALEKGVVEAADASAYVNNDAVGLNQIAHYPIYPGIHSQANLQFTLNQEKWNSLSEAHQALIDTWFYAMIDDLRRTSKMKDLELVRRDRQSDEITVVDWPQDERDQFRRIASEAWKEYAEKGELAQEALDAHFEFMERIGLL